MIEMYGVTKVYPGGQVALKDISFKIAKGEFVFVVGPSGAGKSTLIKLLFREELPTKGQIFFAGKNITRMKRREIPYLRRRIGIVFQDFRLLPDKTVYENIAFAMQVVEASNRDIKKRVPYVLERVGLSHKAKARPSELSGGEQQRVALARAIVNNPDVLVADEPTGNLDPDTSRDIMNLLDDINKMGTTLVVASHARELVDSMKKRVIRLEEGSLVSDEERGLYINET
ncbi:MULTISPECIES: cell division ATP-binding protein FtsE [Tepidanaerobacter]|uniref:Cell division ATP-binding protein FtsE n=1 Tax=Tepidanaerobacter syntrophicus TaxID=224999 RepID=A0A0U9HK76_9FIRM|nr:cell division transport system ATP-binding protein [Tepidanaerobacter syntrophicus]GLI20140.1 cell division ATP-binding protein FtsE [Tepidanaerobacter syntrophicus]GLI50586.1 cell division ATP-binding protein FtsE [Tepidanaerobacter syntrophicus]HHV83731.1 cell division ATP-binding protein FtsE [Tepidanaerobacter syntrophicus]